MRNISHLVSEDLIHMIHVLLLQYLRTLYIANSLLTLLCPRFPVFDVNLPKYLSYGAFGSVSGHELSHAFDSTGRNFDQNGNYTDWWTNSTVAGFTERADCFVDQYHNYVSFNTYSAAHRSNHELMWCLTSRLFLDLEGDLFTLTENLHSVRI